MIHTYSVIIQNKTTTEAFLKVYPIFKEAIDNNRIGLCKWNEFGTTIDTAVPELKELTNDKKEWIAYIVMFEKDDCMSGLKTSEQNPYDFLVNAQEKEELLESEVPLIRLAHMLGGVPAPDMKYVCEIVEEEGKAPRRVYRMERDEANEKAHEVLSKKYEFDGVAPTSIVMITVREGYDKENHLNLNGKVAKGSYSENFWKRNNYPSKSRFLVYDFEKKGPVQRNADEFGFWMSVMLLTTNELETDVLQAYKLYNLKTKFDTEQMRELFEGKVRALKSARVVIEKEIKSDIENKLTTESELPEYKIEVPLTYELPKEEDQSVDTQQFGFVSKSIGSEMALWNIGRKNAEEWLDNSVRKVERALDMTANRMRECCTFSEYEVSTLDEYQEEDMIRETGKLYEEIVELQGELPLNRASDNPEIESAAEAVWDYLRCRVTMGGALVSMTIVLVLLVLGHIPAISDYANNGVGNIGALAITIGAEWLLVLLFAVLVLVIQGITAKGLLSDYNDLIQMAYSRLATESQLFAKYISNIASHSRGHSYMNLSHRKKHYIENDHFLKHRHIKAINIFWGQIKAWSAAYHLPINFDEIDVDENIIVDTSVSPLQSSMYTFEVEQTYPVEVNKSGYTISSPFCFAKRIEITKEELYDDDEGAR